MGKPGRPKNPLEQPPTEASGAIRLLVDRLHRGNVREASLHTGLPYGTLRQLYSGVTGTPSVRTLEVLAESYRVPLDWFLKEPGDRGRPMPDLSIEGRLPPDPESGPAGRRVRIPLAAASLHRVWTLLWRYLRALPATRDRPILGGARDEDEGRRRLTVFLLGPLLAAHEQGEGTAIHAEPPFPGQRRPSAADQEAWLERLIALGRFWETALPDLLARAAAHSPGPDA